MLAVGTGGGGGWALFGYFSLAYHPSLSLSLSLRHLLDIDKKNSHKGPLNPKQPNQQTTSIICLDSKVVSSHSLSVLKTIVKTLSVLSFIKEKKTCYLKYFVTKKKNN